jgi:hypothetical protein
MSPQEALFPDHEASVEYLKRFIERETALREQMLAKHPEREAYWRLRISEAEEASLHLGILAGTIARLS